MLLLKDRIILLSSIHAYYILNAYALVTVPVHNADHVFLLKSMIHPELGLTRSYR